MVELMASLENAERDRKCIYGYGLKGFKCRLLSKICSCCVIHGWILYHIFVEILSNKFLMDGWYFAIWNRKNAMCEISVWFIGIEMYLWICCEMFQMLSALLSNAAVMIHIWLWCWILCHIFCWIISYIGQYKFFDEWERFWNIWNWDVAMIYLKIY